MSLYRRRAQLEALSVKQAQLLRIAAADIAGITGDSDDHLTRWREAMIDAVVQRRRGFKWLPGYGKPNHLNEREGRGLRWSLRCCGWELGLQFRS